MTEIQEHIEALKTFADEAENDSLPENESEDIRVKKTQLRAIKRTIAQLERSGVPVPNGVRDEQLALASEIEKLEHASGSVCHTYDQLLCHWAR